VTDADNHEPKILDIPIGLDATGMRQELDSLGDVEVPANRYWGNGPKLNGPFIPLAVGAYILAWGTMGGPYAGASMNPARSFGPDVAIGNLSAW
jgi:hypothetical protein